MGRAPCCDKDGLKKGPWAPEEDLKLINYIQAHGHGNWRTLPKNAGELLEGTDFSHSFFQLVLDLLASVRELSAVFYSSHRGFPQLTQGSRDAGRAAALDGQTT